MRTSHRDDPSIVVASSNSTTPQGLNLVTVKESIKIQSHCKEGSLGSSPYGATDPDRSQVHHKLPVESVLQELQVDLFSDIHGPKRDYQLIMGCRKNSSPVYGAPPPSPSSMTWVSAQLFLSHIFTPLWVAVADVKQLFPFLNLLQQRHLCCWLALASGGSGMELVCTGCVGHGGCHSLSQKPPLDFPGPKPVHANLGQKDELLVKLSDIFWFYSFV